MSSEAAPGVNDPIPDTIEGIIQHFHDKLEALPPSSHLLCPKIDDDDTEDYNNLDDPDSALSRAEKLQRIADGDKRSEITYWNTLMFAADQNKVGVWLKEFGARLEENLQTCDKCVLNWHMKRQQSLGVFAERWTEEAIQHMEDLLHKFDFVRIDTGMKFALDTIVAVEQRGLEFKKSSLGHQYGLVLLAVYEALCCMPYLSLPEKRQQFNRVFSALQSKKTLRLGDKVLLPAMTHFLFDRLPIRKTFAKVSWDALESDGLTERQFDWAVSEYLTKAIQAVSPYGPAHRDQYEDIDRFWEGFLQILRTMSSSMIVHRLRGMEVKPNVYDLLFQHMQCESEAILFKILEAFSMLIEKSPESFWSAIGDARAFAIAEQVFMAPLYRSVLNQAIQLEAASISDFFSPTAWVRVWLRSLSRPRMHDACESLLHLLFETLQQDPVITPSGKATCVKLGLCSLQDTLRAFSSSAKLNTSNDLLYINSMLNLTLKYKSIIADSVEQASFRELDLTETAISVISTALELDSRATSEEQVALVHERPVQQSVFRDSSGLWDAFIHLLGSGNTVVAKSMLMAMLPLVRVERIRPDRKATKPLAPPKVQFNSSLEKTVGTLGRVFFRISEFNTNDLNTLCGDPHTLRPIIVFCLHGDPDISGAATELIKTITSQDARSDAIQDLLSQLLRESMLSYGFALSTIMKDPFPWGPMANIINCSRDVIDSLCDPSSGILRLKSISEAERDAVLAWWISQWRCIHHAFDKTEAWSHKIEIRAMTDFCREVIDLADHLLAQDGVVASALEKSMTGVGTNVLKRILKPCNEWSFGIVKMIRLRDEHLVRITVKILVKLFQRLRENGLEIVPDSKDFVRRACVVGDNGKYITPTNLTDQQRAELMRALGEDDPDVQVVDVRPRVLDKAPRQGTIDAWAKSGSSKSSSVSSSAGQRSFRDEVMDMSSSVEKHSSVLDKMKARQAQKATVKPKTPPDNKAIQAKQSALREARQKAKAEMAEKNAAIIAKARALRAEGGGKEKSDIMVDSSEEEPSEDEEELQSFARETAAGQKSANAAEERRRQAILAQKARMPVKKIKQARSQKDMRARVDPRMEPLHASILEWDIFHEGADPPGSEGCAKVASSYQTSVDYRNTFYPLLVYEAWRSFVTAKDECTAKPFGVRVISRMNVDSFLEITAMQPIAQHKERGLSEGDILLFSQSSQPLDDKSALHCLGRIHSTKFKKDQVEYTFRLALNRNQMTSILRPQTDIFAVKITNMTTIEREYAAMESLQFCELRDEVLDAKPSPLLQPNPQRLDRVMENYALNPGQAKAVISAMDNDAFTLIQGPPGTGKTKTIVAMVGALLTGIVGQAPPMPARPMQPNPVGRPGGPSPPVPKKLLVCAPSNAAVDELVLRLKQGVKTDDGAFHKVRALRLGRSDAINAAVKDVTLDELVRVRLEGDTTRDDARNKKEKLHADAGRIKEELAIVRQRLDEAQQENKREAIHTLQRQIDALRMDQQKIGRQIDADKDSGNTVAREVEIRRRQIQQEILNSAEVLCATLSGSGHEMFKSLNVEFETVIIDEAAQCVELSALIPLKYGCLKCILVGDPKQLPPTVLSQSAAKYGYDQSLFVRMQQNRPQDVHLLDRQYRMHPEISVFPSREFYEGRLFDGADMGKLRQQPWHDDELLGPYRFFDVKGVQERGRKGQSLINVQEIHVAIQLYEKWIRENPRLDRQGKFGIITPYKAQLFELRSMFTGRFGEGVKNDIEFNTTDAFQGRECEIIIFSCVRASPTGGIGFMTDIRRMNVGLTRAKSSLWILGDSRALVQGPFWKRLIEDAQERKLYSSGDIMTQLKRKGQRRERPDAVMTDAPPLPSDSSLPPSGLFGNDRRMSGSSDPKRSDGPSSHAGQDAGTDSSNPAQLAPGVKRPADETGGDVRETKRIATPSTGRSTTLAAKMTRPKPQHGKHAASRPPVGPPVMTKAERQAAAREAQEAAKPGQDPSAMRVLGLIPPERPARPPPIPMPTGSTSTSSTGSTAGGGRAVPPPRPLPSIPKRKTTVDPFIKRKPPPKR